ncbi:alpha/beta hydrolase-fold protein [Mesonia sp. MT50]|uniref:Alpha/beta hydrolase-fold protein n=1 Tax=Mesonia profundi TaxID=3070998 RepID=A0ABU1A5G4_9FLAO|nr:alpha/beta hydrolase-fold protein [Mesonia profundi]MDQ7918219.1 alpha/beta hydrolase-fold protein [Mesonia profundi]
MLTNLIGFIFLSIISCQSKKSQSNSTSKFFTDSIYSEHLNEYQKHNVYLPKGFDRDKNYSIIYGTDGNKNLENSSIKKNLDSLIENHIIKPIIYIGSHSNDKIADSTSVRDNDGNKIYLHYRNFEYVEQDYLELINPNLADRFKNHMLYFKDELIPQVEEKLNPNSTKKDRLFYGVSNGAGFGANLLNKPVVHFK